MYFCRDLKVTEQQKAIIIGAGPAGLTAALELLRHSNVVPIILEASSEIGGISRTVNYKGNRMDIGGHRFFSKSDTVMNWWLELFPVEIIKKAQNNLTIKYQNKTTQISTIKNSVEQTNTDKVMLVRNRLSRIFYLRKFFPYPISLSLHTLQSLGFLRTFKIGISYIKIRLFPIKNETNLEQFFINRFGTELYRTFFKDYTEKVWGIPCSEISAEWGAQRIKGLSISQALKHAVKSKLKSNQLDIAQKNIETSLIEQFLYPKFGPGQLWEEVARQIIEKGGEIHFNHSATLINQHDQIITSISASHNNEIITFTGDYFFSTMPVKDLIAGFEPKAPESVSQIAQNLIYRDFITVGLLVKKLKVSQPNGEAILDNWIYIQESDVKIGRLQVFNNWSPHMVANPDTIWLGLEYFCNEGDDLWKLTDEEILDLAKSELHKINIIDRADVLDGTVVRVPKTYPAYFGAYEHFNQIRTYTDSFTNLFLIGRNGMHKYNNQDHSMLTAIAAVQNIIKGELNKDNIWSINTEMEYHEEK